MPLITIIMPAYNSEQTIQESINSIQKQTYDNWELLIIDDGSKDNTINIVLNIIKNDNRIKLYRNTKKGVSSARNFGIDNAKGDYICFLDSDDLYSENVINNRVKFMKDNNVQATTCEIVLTDKNLNDVGWVMRGKKVFNFEDFHGCPVHTNSVMFQKSVFEKLRFDENFSNGEDWLMWQRIARMGIDFHRVDGCRIYYRQQEGAVRKNFLKHEDSLLDVLDVVYGEDPDCPTPIEKYQYGLTAPNKNATVLKRRIGLFNYLLLEKKFKEADKVGQEILENNAEVSINDIIAIIKYSTTRYYLCHTKEHLDYIKTNKVLQENYKRVFSSEIYHKLEKHFFNSKETKLKNYLKTLKRTIKNVYLQYR